MYYPTVYTTIILSFPCEKFFKLLPFMDLKCAFIYSCSLVFMRAGREEGTGSRTCPRHQNQWMLKSHDWLSIPAGFNQLWIVFFVDPKLVESRNVEALDMEGQLSLHLYLCTLVAQQ